MKKSAWVWLRLNNFKTLNLFESEYAEYSDSKALI